MATRQRRKSFIHRFYLPAIAVLFLGYFAFHIFNGNFGIHAHHMLELEIAERNSTLDALVKEREALERRVALMRPESLDQDMIDEYARSTLNLSSANELTVLLVGN